ncbi:TetR/AcrR family transcriptional regulator [Micromonospora zamorensis]|uniref:TetR/AcrR family transcriptional regulator n=1 Tax=Micromonospora zamorensis TaxID=709883 RepID=UPI003CEC2832
MLTDTRSRTPCKLAEQQGWDAVTTRRLGECIEYSQPVLYSHFRGKREIIGAVALQGATEMATAVRAATAAVDGPRERVAALARAYLDFAARNPTESLGEVAGDGVDPGLFTEVFWASLHGLATLTRTGRLLPEHTESRVELLVDRLAML